VSKEKGQRKSRVVLWVGERGQRDKLARVWEEGSKYLVKNNKEKEILTRPREVRKKRGESQSR